MKQHKMRTSALTLLCSLVVARAWFLGVAPAHQFTRSSTGAVTPFAPSSIRRRGHNLAAEANRAGRGEGEGRGRTRTRMVAVGNNWAWGKSKNTGDARTPASKAFSTGQELKLGVLLLNLGGPERQEDVEPFLYNLFADPDIIRLPNLVKWLQGPIASILAARRCVGCFSLCCCTLYESFFVLFRVWKVSFGSASSECG